jgi:hypothetical protein
VVPPRSKKSTTSQPDCARNFKRPSLDADAQHDAAQYDAAEPDCDGSSTGRMGVSIWLQVLPPRYTGRIFGGFRKSIATVQVVLLDKSC